MALFLKYRPQTFYDLVGQESVVKTLQNALKTHKSTHAYLFAGSRGTGKTSTARIFAKELICQNIQDAQLKEKLIQQITEGSLVDVIEIDGASNRGIDEIRDLRDKIRFAPTIADKKVYIIDEVHMLTTQAFNALLKTLEEPPSHAYFLLATTEMHKLPETIVSRCQCFTFQRFTLDQIVHRLEYIAQEEGFSYDKEALSIIAKKAEGGMRDAISLLDQIAAETENNIAHDLVIQSLGISAPETLTLFFDSILRKNTDISFEILRQLKHNGIDFRTFGHDFLSFLREQMHLHLKNPEALKFIVACIHETEKALIRLKNTPIIELPLEIAVLEIVALPHSVDPDIFDFSCSPLTTPKAVKNPIQKEKIQYETKQKKETTIVTPQEVMITETITVEADILRSPSLETVDSSKNLVEDIQEELVLENEEAEDPFNGFIFDDTEGEKPVFSPSFNGEKVTVSPVGTLASSPKNTEQNTSIDTNVFSSQSIQKSLVNIAEKAKLPDSAKATFVTTQASVEGEKIIFYGTSEITLQRLMAKPEFRIKIQKAIADLFGQTLSIAFEVKKTGSKTHNEPELANIGDFAEWSSL